jgi:hypothetical protein
MVINVSALRASTELPPIFAKPVVISSRRPQVGVGISKANIMPLVPGHATAPSMARGFFLHEQARRAQC